MKHHANLLFATLLGVLALSPSAQAINLQIPSRPTQFPLEIDTNGGPGFVVAWGDNTYGQTNVPVGLSNVAQVSIGQTHTLALKNDGTVVAWGDNTYGQTNVPVGLSNVVQVAAGYNFSYAVKNDGSTVAWGDSRYGALLGTNFNSNVVSMDFILDGPPPTFIYLYTNGTVLGPPNAEIIGLSNVVQITKGLCFLESNGIIVCAGDNSYGQTNVPNGLTNVVEVDAGYGFNVALKNNGTVIAWGADSGNNSYSQTNIPTGLTNVIQIAAVKNYSILALKNDGTVVAWGGNTYGQTNVPVGLTNIVQITGGTKSAVAIGGPFNQIISPLQSISPQLFGVPFSIQSPSASSGLPVTLSIKSGPATISGNTVTPNGTGTVVLAANQPGNAEFNAASEVTTSFVVKNFAQTITPFNTIPNKTYGVAPFTITLPTATSRLPVSVTVQSGPATISTNKVIITGAGTVVLAADQSGNSNYLAAPQVTTSFTVSKANQSIAAFKTISNQSYNTPFSVTPPSTTSGLPVTLSVRSGPATISGNSVTPTGIGAVVIVADQPGNANYNAASEVTVSFTAIKASQSISFPSIPPQDFAHPIVSITPPTSTSGLPVTTKVLSGPATISGSTVTLTGVGTVVLAANQSGDADYLQAPQATTSFVVKSYNQTLTPFVSISDKTYGVAPFTITPPIASSGLTVTVTIQSGPATISKNRVTITGAGTVVLAANQGGNASYTAAPQVTTSFTVSPANQTIAPFKPISPVTYSTTKSVTVTPPASSSGLAVKVTVQSGPATISGSKVSLTGTGTVVLVANQAGNTNYNPATPVTVSFTVK